MRRRVASWIVISSAVFVVSPHSFGAHAVQGAVGNVTAADAADLKDVACRSWSTSDVTVNANQRGANPQCVNARCPRTYNKNPMLEPGGYICPGEDTIAYSADKDNQVFYLLTDAQSFGDSCRHVGYYAVQGVVARSEAPVAGDFRQAGCTGIAVVNCYERADNRSSRRSPISAASEKSGSKEGAATRPITSIGGLSPIPIVRVSYPGDDCPSGQARLTWDEPELYKSTMKNDVPSPVKGVRLWSNSSPCGTCPDGNHGWKAGATFPVGAGSKGVCMPVDGPAWYALTVRLTGPNALESSSSEIETGRLGESGFVGANSLCVEPAKK